VRKNYIKTFALVSAIAFSASGMALAAPLAPGKPAGVRAAQMGDTEWLLFGGLAVVLAAVVIANSTAGHDAVPAPVFTVVTT
jgi:hypothetical protein